jgi:hypothetical protein|tara:strand:+ start:5301 stop:5504 length:204 start_codon:yes stop_codon:yes gene_type:complete
LSFIEKIPWIIEIETIIDPTRKINTPKSGRPKYKKNPKKSLNRIQKPINEKPRICQLFPLEVFDSII